MGEISSIRVPRFDKVDLILRHLSLDREVIRAPRGRNAIARAVRDVVENVPELRPVISTRGLVWWRMSPEISVDVALGTASRPVRSPDPKSNTANVEPKGSRGVASLSIVV